MSNQHTIYYSIYVCGKFKKRVKGAKAWQAVVRGENEPLDMLDCPVNPIYVKSAKGKIVYRQAEGLV